MLVCSDIKNYTGKPLLLPNYEENEINILTHNNSALPQMHVFSLFACTLVISIPATLFLINMS